jgi:O-methyltransferase
MPDNDSSKCQIVSDGDFCPPASARASAELVPTETFESGVAGVVEGMRQRHLTVSWGDRLLTLDKSASFMEEPAFERAYRQIHGSHIYDQYNGSDTIAWRLNTLCWAARCGMKVGGDFVECGVFKGDMSWLITQVIGEAVMPHFYLYDSFEGFSPDLSTPDDYPLNPGFLDFANGIYRDPSLYGYVKDRFASNPNVTVTKGFLPEALDVVCPESIGFLHVDLNSPKAEVAVLERLFDRVRPGGVIIFDDYGWKLFSPQKIAEDTFMAARGYEILELPTGQGLVFKR